MVHLKLALAAIIWGGTFITAKIALLEITPLSAGFLRFAIATVFLWLILFIKERRFPRIQTWQEGVLLFLLGATGVFGYNALFFEGLQWIEANRASLITALTPITTFSLTCIMAKQMPRPLSIVGVLLSLFGAIVVITHGNFSLLVQGQLGRGELYMIACTACWTAYTLIGHRVMHRFSPLAASSYATLIGGVMLGIPAISEGVLTHISDYSLHAWGGILYMALLGTVLAFIWFYEGIRTIGADRAVLFINLIPLSAVIFSVVFLNESVQLYVLLGGACVLSGIYLTTTSKRSLQR